MYFSFVSGSINSDIRKYLNTRFPKGGVDHDLQNTIRYVVKVYVKVYVKVDVIKDNLLQNQAPLYFCYFPHLQRPPRDVVRRKGYFLSYYVIVYFI